MLQTLDLLKPYSYSRKDFNLNRKKHFENFKYKKGIVISTPLLPEFGLILPPTSRPFYLDPEALRIFSLLLQYLHLLCNLLVKLCTSPNTERLQSKTEAKAKGEKD